MDSNSIYQVLDSKCLILRRIMGKGYYQENGRLNLKGLAKLRGKLGTRIFTPDGKKLIYILQKGQAVDYQKLLKK